MPIYVGQNEPVAERRRAYFWLVQSNGTTPASNESGNRPQWSLNGSAYTNSTNTLSAVSAGAGKYVLDLTQSETSVLGVMKFRYSSTTCFEQEDTAGGIQILPNNPYVGQYLSQQSRLQGGTTSAISLGSGETTLDNFFNGAGVLLELPNGDRVFNIISDYTGATRSAQMQNTLPATPASTWTYQLYPGTTATDAANAVWSASTSVYSVAGTFGLQAQQASTASQTVADAVWNFASLKTVDSVLTLRGALSTLSLPIQPGTYSSVTVGAVTNVVNGVSIAAGSYSNVTVSTGNIAPNTYSGVTVQGVSTVSGVAAGVRQDIANSLLSTNLGNSRLVQEALFAIRNRVQTDPTSSVLTVYGPDDTTSSWTASITTSTNAISGFNPNG